MTNLYQLTATQRALQAQLEAGGFDDQTISDTLEGDDNTESLLEKRLAYISIIKSKRAFSEARAKAADEMAALAEVDDRDADRLEAALLASMKATGDSHLVGLQFEAIIRRNPPSVELVDGADVPPIYWRTPEPKNPVAVIDKAAIKAELQAGREVRGARLVQNTRLEIR